MEEPSLLMTGTPRSIPPCVCEGCCIMRESGAVEGIIGCGGIGVVVDVVHCLCCEQFMAQQWWAYNIFNPKTLAEPVGNV